MPCRSYIFVALAALASSVGPAQAQQAERSPTDLPADVVAFIGRRSACDDWSSKTAADPKASAPIDDVMRSLKCSDLATDERALRARYASDQHALKAIDASWRKVVRRVPVAPATLPPDLDR